MTPNLKGIGTGKITHVGGGRKWLVQDINGNDAIFEEDEAYVSSAAPYSLLCPHSWRESQNNRRYQNGETDRDGAAMAMDLENNGGYLLTVATICVDHFTDIDYVHIQESTSAEETIKANSSFERFSVE
jgi:hypothetical protein